jgi:hypothetical protein
MSNGRIVHLQTTIYYSNYLQRMITRTVHGGARQRLTISLNGLKTVKFGRGLSAGQTVEGSGAYF